METGNIAWFRSDQGGSKAGGYGFISPDEGGKDIWFHATELIEGDEAQLVTGTRVCYDVTSSYKGPKAVHVRILAGVSEPVEGVLLVPEAPEDELREQAHALVDKHVRDLVDELGQLLGVW